MRPDDPPDNARKRRRLSPPQRREALATVVEIHTPFTDAEADLLHEVFDDIFTAHRDRVWGRLARRSLSCHDAEELMQDAFIDLYCSIIERGYPRSLEALFTLLIKNRLLNYLRARRRSPFSGSGLPSSSILGKPSSEPDLERAMDLRELKRRVPRLSEEDQDVLEACVIFELKDEDAADLLDLKVGTLKSRLREAKRRFLELAVEFLPLDEQVPT